MNFRLWIFCALFACGQAFARPLVLAAEQKLDYFPPSIAHSGDEIIATRFVYDGGSDDNGTSMANLYRRNAGGAWEFQRTLIAEATDNMSGDPSVSMHGAVAVIRMPSGLHVFERTASGWAEIPIDGPVPHGYFTDVHDGTILANQAVCAPQAAALNRLANGHWGVTGVLQGPPGSCLTGLDLHSGVAILHHTFPAGTSRATIFDVTPGGWVASGAWDSPAVQVEQYGPAVAIRGALALVSGSDRGAHVYRRGSFGWTEAGLLDNPDSYEGDQVDHVIQIQDDLVLKTGWNINRDSPVAYLYRERPDKSFDHLANLTVDNPNGFGSARLSGRHVIVPLTAAAGEIELPASFSVPNPVQYDFESGSTAQWTPLASAAFGITSNGNTSVYRQSSLAGDAGAVHSAELTNQSITADIEPLAFNGNDRWVGLMTRYTDESNFYYVTLRDSNTIVLKLRWQGFYTELGSAPLDVRVGRPYRVTLESTGALHNVYVDGRRVIQQFYFEQHHGRTGLRMYKARADFDNVVVSAGPVASLAYTRIEALGEWGSSLTDLLQSSTSAPARRTTGQPREDAVVQARISVTQATQRGSPWVGLIARYVDAGNYYYVTARRSNELSLRKLTNGAINVLGTVPMPAAFSGQPFVLRLEAIGDRLRVYLNGELMIERAGAEIVAGKVGTMTYRAGAWFNDYAAYEP